MAQNDIVRLKNVGDQTWQDAYANSPYICPPGDSIIVPFDAACLWLGDPRVTDKPTLSQYDRRAEVSRVETRLGITVARGEGRELPLPQVEIQTLEGERVLMAVEDPDGNASLLKGNLKAGLDDREAVAQELEIVKAQQASLLAKLEELQNANAPTLADALDDVPTKVPGK